MFTRLAVIPIVLACCWPAHAVEERHGFLVGQVLRVDSAGKTVVVKAADGTEHTFHFLKGTAVHGSQAVSAAAKDTFHGVQEGTQVAVHYTAKGTAESADEIDDIGKDGLRKTQCTVDHVDRAARTLTVKTANGAEETYQMSGHAARDAGAGIAAGTGKSARVTVYYSEKGGHKVVHFFKRAI